MKRKSRIAALGVVCLLLISACTERGVRLEDIPTAASIDALATALPLTQNAPPTPFNLPQTTFDFIDNHLNELAGWRYVVQLDFNGMFARTPRQASASAQAEVWFNQMGSARRITLNTTGELIGQAENTAYEAVRLGPDSFLVREGACLVGARGDAQTAADLRAGDLDARSRPFSTLPRRQQNRPRCHRSRYPRQHRYPRPGRPNPHCAKKVAMSSESASPSRSISEAQRASAGPVRRKATS